VEGDDYGFVYTKNGEQYCFSVRPETRQAVLSFVGRLAVNPDLDFDWHDALNVTSVIRQTVPVAGTLRDVIDDYEASDGVHESLDDWSMMVTMLVVGGLGWWGIWLLAKSFV
jgi:hypothetical protein